MTTMASNFYSVVHVTVRGACVVWALPSNLSSFAEHKLVLRKGGRERRGQ